jgi:filamentous hemagglutinin
VGGDINSTSLKNINILASNLTSQNGDISLIAKEEVNILSGADLFETKTTSKKSGLTTRASSKEINQTTTQVSSNVGADNGSLTILSGDDTNIVASNLSGSDDVNIAAGRYADQATGDVTNNLDANVNILSAKDVEYSLKESQKTSLKFNDIEEIAKMALLTSAYATYAAPMAIGGGAVVANGANLIKLTNQKNISESLNETIVSSNITSTNGGNININSGANTTILASNLSSKTNQSGKSGDININAGQLLDGSGNILTNDAAKVTISGDANKKTSYSKSENMEYAMEIQADGLDVANYQNSKDQNITIQNVASNLNSAGNININSQGDLAIKGSDLNANLGDINLSSANNSVTIASAQNYQDSTHEEDSGTLGLNVDQDLTINLGEFEMTEENKGNITNIASNLNAHAGTININANGVGGDSDNGANGSENAAATGDVNLLASNLSAKNGVNIAASNNINVLNSFDQSWSETSHKKGSAQLKFETTSNELSAKAGVNYQQEKNKSTNNFVVSSNLVSDSGSVTAESDKDLNIVASNIVAKQDIDLSAGDNLNVVSSDQVSANSSSMLEVDAGIRIGIDHNLGSAYKSFEEAANIDIGGAINGSLGIVEGLVGGEGLDGTLSGNEDGVNGLMTGLEAYQTFKQGPSAGAAISVNVEISGSESKSNNSNAVGSNLIAGNDVNLTTSDNGTDDNDIVIKGGNIEAENDVNLTSGDDVEIVASQNNSSSSSQSFGLEVDVDIYGTSGSGATSINGNIAQNKSTSTSHNNTSINADNNINIKTENNTDIKGANIFAKNDLNVDTGNDLNVESLQNSSNSSSNSFGIGAGFGGSGGTSVNANIATSKASRKWVDDQTTLTGGNSVTINTGGNTNLTGAVIANQTTDPITGEKIDGGNLTINTGSLTFQNIEDKDKARSVSLGGGVGNNTTTGAVESGNVNFAYSSHDKQQLTKATIGGGTINIGGEEVLGTDTQLSGLNRDITNSQEITKNQVVDEVSGSITFTSEEKQKERDTNADGSEKTFEDRAREWLRPDQTLTTAATGLAVASGATEVASGINKVQGFVDENGGDLVEDGVVVGAKQTKKGLQVGGEALEKTRVSAEKNLPLYSGYLVGAPISLVEGTIFTFFESKDDNGSYLENKNGKTNDATKTKNYGVNGIMTSEDRARQNYVEGDDKDTTLRYNPTHGFLGDLVESGVGKVANAIGIPEIVAMNNYVADDLYQRRDLDQSTSTFHSQGTIIGTGAMQILAPRLEANNQFINQSQTFEAVGPAVLREDWRRSVESIGMKFDKEDYRHDDKDPIRYLTSPSNAINQAANLVGINNFNSSIYVPNLIDIPVGIWNAAVNMESHDFTNTLYSGNNTNTLPTP